MINNRLLKITALFLCICFIMPFIPFGADAAAFVLNMGDSNCDGSVNTYDVTTILRHCIGEDLSFYGEIASDVNDDDEINTLDASMLLRMLASSSDYIQPMEITGDLKNPILYTDISYIESENVHSETLYLSEYTADAVRTPSNTVSFGQGFSVTLSEGKNYVFETQSQNDTSLDTMMYLLDSASIAFITDDNSGDGKFSRIEFYAWQSGTYKILVTGKSTNTVGTCRLTWGEHEYIPEENGASAPQTPTPAPTSTATPKPSNTPTPTPTASPTPTQPPVGGMSFDNETVPENGDVIQYKKPYSMKGTVETRHAIELVRAEIRNSEGVTEMTAQRAINPDLDLHRYSLTDGGETSVNAQLKIADLSFGTKTFNLFCKTEGESEKLIFTSEFYVGATDSLLEGNGFMGSASMQASQRRAVLDFINSLDENEFTTTVIMEAFCDLGTKYGQGSGELDCSSLVQKAYRAAGINLPRTSAEQGRYCYNLNGEIDLSDVITADLVFYRSTNCHCGRFREIHHVSLMLGPIDDTWYYIEASSGKKKVVLRRAWGDTSGWAIEFYGRPY